MFARLAFIEQYVESVSFTLDEVGNLLAVVLCRFVGIDEIKFKDDGTSHLKLQALPVLLDVTKITKITGDYNNVRPYLFVDKVMGGVNFCLGLTKEEEEYVPSSALLEDIKKLTDTPSQVLAILEKDVNGNVYETIKHVAKGLNLNHVQLPDEIRNKIDLKKQNNVFSCLVNRK